MSLGNNMILASGTVIEPENVSVPVVTGTVETGQTLTGTDGAWNTSGDFTRQWQRGSDATSWSNISGATNSTYVLTSNDAGYRFRFAVTLTNDAGTATANSVQTGTQAGQWYSTSSGSNTSWTAPAGVTQISIFGVGQGGQGSSYCNQVTSGVGGGGGAAGYSNNVSVTPGQTYYVNFQQYYQSGQNGWTFYANVSGITSSSAGASAPESSYLFYMNSAESPGKGVASKSKADTKNDGGQGSPNNSSGGAGAGGYTGAGGSGGSGNTTAGDDGAGGGGGGACGMASYSNSGGGGGPSGGGVGLNGEGPSGAGGTWNSPTFGGGKGGSGGDDGGDATQQNTTSGKNGGNYGSGGGGGGAWYGWGPCSPAGQNAPAAIRIIWGSGRAYPSTNTADV